MFRVHPLLFTFLSSFSIVILGVSLVTHIFRIPANKCEMTYMFQWPEYLEISMPKEVEEKFPRYGLYVYGEGAYSDRLRRGEFHGIPVLFIPGNAGSHRQVRSLASVSLKKTEKAGRGNSPEFNYFSIDYDEELSGLYGGYLQRQTEFAAHCLQRIFDLYSAGPHRPNSIIVVGHSMGGVIARGLFLIPNASSLINVMITLASPHATPAAMFDRGFNAYYAEIRDFWLSNINEALANVTVLSVGGGRRDIMVRSDLTLFDDHLRLATSDNDRLGSGLVLLETRTPSIPLVWSSTDHLCIVWCKQLVLAVVRSLFDMTEHNSGRVGLSSDTRMHRKAIIHHFFQRDDWKSNAKTKKDYQAELDEEKKMTEDILEYLAAVFRDYVHFMPALCLSYICIWLIQGMLVEYSPLTETNGISICAFLMLSSSVFALRIENGDWIKAALATVMAVGLFSATYGLARILFGAARRCCRSNRQSPSCMLSGLSHYDALGAFAAMACLILSWMYSSTLLLLFVLLIGKLISQERSLEKAENVIMLIQTCLLLVILTVPWAAVWLQNFHRRGNVLPHDPTALPALLWIMANIVSRLFIFSGIKRAFIPFTVAAISLFFCDRLYITTHGCAFLLGLYYSTTNGPSRTPPPKWSSKKD